MTGMDDLTKMTIKPYYSHDGITIYHGDALFVIPELKDIGAVVTDPPYSSGGLFRGDRTASTVEKYVQSGTVAYRSEFAGDNRDQRSFLAWSTLWMCATRYTCAVGGPILVFSDWRQLPTTVDAVQCGGWTWRNICTWHKPGIRMQRGRFSGSAEYIVYGTNGPAVDGKSSPKNVFECAPIGDKSHIAEKPMAVMQWLMGVVPDGAIVLDPFLGSGTTLEAAKLSGHPAIGIEVDESHCERAARRLDQQVLF